MEIIIDGKICIVDEEDMEWISLLNLTVKHNSGKLYYVYADGMLLHKLVFLHKGERVLPGNAVDHINRNSLDNRKINLRQLSRMDNLRLNASKRKGSSKYIGVIKSGLKWIATYKGYSIGAFKTEIEAAKAYDLHISVYAERALRLNFPEDYLPIHELLKKAKNV